VGLIFNLLAVIMLTAMRIIGFMAMLMVTAIASLFIGSDTATERISSYWIQQSTSSGFPIGYNPNAREGLKTAAGGLLALGWFLNVGLVILVISMVA